MNISNFNTASFPCLIDTYKKWWAGTLNRPIINLQVSGINPGMDAPFGAFHPCLSHCDLTQPMDKIVDYFEYLLYTRRYLFDSYPSILPDFGAGVNAAFCGCKEIVRSETVWFEPEVPVDDIEVLNLKHNDKSFVWQCICDFYRVASKRFGGNVVLAMTHLNNGIDILARFLDSVELGIALYDQPDNIMRLIWQNHGLLNYYIRTLSTLMKGNPGYTCWGDILAPEPYMGMQSDYCSMISHEHFKQFVLPELEACFKAYPNYNFYHLDGEEEIRHLDMLLSINEMRCLQWVHGVSKGEEEDYFFVYKEAINAGKNVWVTGGLDTLEHIADYLGSLQGVFWQGFCGINEEEDYIKKINKLGVC